MPSKTAKTQIVFFIIPPRSLQGGDQVLWMCEMLPSVDQRILFFNNTAYRRSAGTAQKGAESVWFKSPALHTG
jgi:hypothetical protein